MIISPTDITLPVWSPLPASPFHSTSKYRGDDGHHHPLIQSYVLGVRVINDSQPASFRNRLKPRFIKQIFPLVRANSDEIGSRCGVIPTAQADGLAVMGGAIVRFHLILPFIM
jgi:hypothetical protein